MFLAALPSIFTGLTVAMGLTWLMVMAAEMIASRGGLGHLTWEAYATLNDPLIFVGIGVIGIVGSLSRVAIRLLGRRLMRGGAEEGARSWREPAPGPAQPLTFPGERPSRTG